MSGKFILDAFGQPVEEPDIFRWAGWYEDSGDTRRVGRTQVGNFLVSTVFLALDHSFRDGRPLLYETMIFKDDIGVEEDCWRYSTKQEALEGHERVVSELKAKYESGTP